MSEGVEVSFVMPCLDEAETLEACISAAQRCIESHGLAGEIIVADNGSSDGSQEIARRCGARVVDVKERGYGAALMGGFEAATGRYLVMGDADESYDFAEVMPMIELKLLRTFVLVRKTSVIIPMDEGDFLTSKIGRSFRYSKELPPYGSDTISKFPEGPITVRIQSMTCWGPPWNPLWTLKELCMRTVSPSVSPMVRNLCSSCDDV